VNQTFIPMAASSKKTSASCENFLILLPRFEDLSFLHFVADVVDDLVHRVERQTENHDFGMLVGMEKPSRECPFGPCLAFFPEDLGHVPAMFLDLGKEFPVSRMKPFALTQIACHAQ